MRFAAVSALALSAVFGALAMPAAAQSADPSEPAFRALYKELIETNTTVNNGSCTLAAERMKARLIAAGYTDKDAWVFSTPEHPKDGGLVAVLKGSTKAKGILLLAHIDVVEAKREDWIRDPFTLIEEDGYFYGRGTLDDKAMAAVFTDLLIRYKQEGYKPKRDIKLALTCGEETSGAFNGADWLARNHKDWIDAEFALNEGGGGANDEHGKPQVFSILAAEKVYQDFIIETTNPGGHSSQPVPDNAIYEMSAAMTKVSGYEFPAQFNDVTRAFFTRIALVSPPEVKTAIQDLLKDPGNAAANAIVSKDKKYHSMLRTTCVATLIDGGHALNALPQKVKANVNCRMFPGSKVEDVQSALITAIGDPKVSVTIKEPRSPATPTAALKPEVVKAVETLATKYFPGVPIIPTMSTGATDAIYTSAAGIPTYGIDGNFVDADFNGIHGLNERISVKSLMTDRKFQYDLVKTFTSK